LVIRADAIGAIEQIASKVIQIALKVARELKNLSTVALSFYG